MIIEYTIENRTECYVCNTQAYHNSRTLEIIKKQEGHNSKRVALSKLNDNNPFLRIMISCHYVYERYIEVILKLSISCDTLYKVVQIEFGSPD